MTPTRILRLSLLLLALVGSPPLTRADIKPTPTIEALFGQSIPVASTQCKDCHAREYEQWRTSRHALALSPGVVGQLPAFDDITVRMCLNCHAPLAARHTTAPAEITADSEAVGCIACHMREGEIVGPRDLGETPHGPVIGDQAFRQADFCAPCHQFESVDVAVNGKLLENTLEEWRSSRYGELGVVCQACHMAGGYHGFRGIHDPATVRRALSMSVKRTPTDVRIEVTNVGAGHAVPTYITPRLTILVASSQESPLRTWTLQRAMEWTPDDGWIERFDSRLMPGETRQWRTPVPSDLSAQVRVIVAPDADYHDRVYPYLIHELRGEIDRQSIRLLETALRQSASSPYELFHWNCGPAGQQDYDCQ